jgi:hypothetical protein
MVAVEMGDEVSDALDAFDAFDRRWAERQGVFEQRRHHRVLELVVMPGQDPRALDVARRRGLPESVRPSIRAVDDLSRGPHAVWTWEWREVEFVPVDGG